MVHCCGQSLPQTFRLSATNWWCVNDNNKHSTHNEHSKASYQELFTQSVFTAAVIHSAFTGYSPSLCSLLLLSTLHSLAIGLAGCNSNKAVSL